MPLPDQGERLFSVHNRDERTSRRCQLYCLPWERPHLIVDHRSSMPGLIKHRGVRIVTLEPGDTVTGHARPGDIMIEQKADGWYVHFIADDGSVDSYEDPFDSHTTALWSAKAAAEFQASGE
jgi:hypothetical protein